MAAPSVWGPTAWAWLHRFAIGFPRAPSAREREVGERALRNFLQGLPCPACKTHAAAHARADPPPFAGGSRALQLWAWSLHNAVTPRLGKRLLPFAEYQVLYARDLARAGF